MPFTPRERYLCALQQGKPDRLPATTMSWMDYHLRTYLPGMSLLEAYRIFGLEACVDASPHRKVDCPDWKEEWVVASAGETTRTEVTVTTPAGQLHWVLEANQYTQWLVEPPIKELEQIRWIDRFYPAPRIDVERVRQVKERVGEDGVVQGEPSGWRQPGPWQDACEWVGTQRMILEAIDHPDWAHEFVEILTRKRLETVESMQGAPYDVILTGGGAASSTVISPRMHKEFCLPYDRRIHDALHGLGYQISYHTCGGMMPILEMIASNGCDCMEPFAPKEIGGDANLREARRRIGDRVCMKGGLDQFNVLERGSEEEIRACVLRIFEEAGQEGGLILCPSDHFFEVPVENLWAYARAVKECVYPA